ncbi:hypothetical protein [Clostridium senegalense]
MGKLKYRRITRNDLNSIIQPCKILSESLEDISIIIKQFNALTSNQRSSIIKEYIQREELLKKQIFYQDEDMYLTCSMVNLNIVASKYDIDPATVCMCLFNPCRQNEKILVL